MERPLSAASRRVASFDVDSPLAAMADGRDLAVFYSRPPGEARLAGLLDLPGRQAGVALSAPWAWLATASPDGALLLVDLRLPEHPAEMDRLPISGTAQSLHAGDDAVAVVAEGIVRVYRHVRGPGTPRVPTATPTPDPTAPAPTWRTFLPWALAGSE